MKTTAQGILSPEQVFRKVGHEARDFVQEVQITALRLQMVAGNDGEADPLVNDLFDRGQRFIAWLQSLCEENIMPNGVPPLRVVVVEDSPRQLDYFVEIAREYNHDVVATARTAREMVESVRRTKPDIVLFDIHLPDGSGLDALRVINESDPVAAVVITGDNDMDLAIRAQQDNIMAYLLKPVGKEQIAIQMGVAWARWQEYISLRRENERLGESLERRKIMERAKGVLMARHRWSESTAYMAIQKAAKNRSEKIEVVAREIIEGKNVVPVETK